MLEKFCFHGVTADTPLLAPPLAAANVALPLDFNDATFDWSQGNSAGLDIDLDLITVVPPLGPQLDLPFDSRARRWFPDSGVE